MRQRTSGRPPMAALEAILLRGDDVLSPLNSERLIGGVIALFGLVYSLHTVDAFDLGTFRRIGPGMFPLGLGIGVTLLGIGIAVLAPDRDRAPPDFSPRAAALVLAGVGGFAATIAAFGLFPAVVISVLVASAADRPYRPLGALGVSVTLCIAAWLIFKVGLGLSIPMLRWPF